MNSSENSDSNGDTLRDAIRSNYAVDEASVMRDLIAQIRLDSSEREAIAAAGAPRCR